MLTLFDSNVSAYSWRHRNVRRATGCDDADVFDEDQLGAVAAAEAAFASPTTPRHSAQNAEPEARGWHHRATWRPERREQAWRYTHTYSKRPNSFSTNVSFCWKRISVSLIGTSRIIEHFRWDNRGFYFRLNELRTSLYSPLFTSICFNVN